MLQPSVDREELNALKAQVDLASIFELNGLKLKPKGKNLFCRCPFHPDKSASLSVNPETQLWNCFGCPAGGDVLNFIQLKEKLEFPEAVKRLKVLAGEHPHSNGSPPNSKPKTLPSALARADVLGRVMEFYQKSLRQNSEAQEYLVSRGLASRELWDAFRLGYADGSLLATLPQSGPVHEALQELGVLSEQGKERMRGCIVVPLEHPDEGLVGLYGRAVDPTASVPHRFLSGPRRGMLHWQALKASSRIWLAESVFDAFSLWQAGVRDVTCLFGVSSLPADLGAAFGRFATQEVVLCLDADQAGREATTRFAASLGQRGIDCFSVALPEGSDPNEVLMQQGPEALAQLAHNSQRVGSLMEQPEPAATITRPQLEEDGEGFKIELDGVSYRVNMVPPFNGSLRILLMASRGPVFHPDKLDLYSHRARAQLAQLLCKKLELSQIEAERHLLVLVQTAQRWQEKLKNRETQSEAMVERKAPELTPEERDAALAFLRRDDLVQAILQDSEALGYVGEDNAKLLGYLIGLSRKLDKPLSGIVRSQSGAGKSALTELVEQLTPPEDVLLYSRLSAQALGYVPKDYLIHKLLILEERAGGEAADYLIRTLQSRRKISQAVVVKDPMTGKMGTQHLEVEGPIAYLETTTNSELNFENTTRCFEIHLDESERQTQRIQQWQRQRRLPQERDLVLVAEEIRTRHHNAQRILERVLIFIPYVEHLSFPSRWLRTRRDHERFLCLIEVSAMLHQHQREQGQTKEGTPYVLATLEDYRIAYRLALNVLAITLHELSRDAQELWEFLLPWVQGQTQPSQVSFNRRKLRESTKWQDHRLRAALVELVEMEYVTVLSGQNGKAFLYQLAALQPSPSPLGCLTTPEELAKRLKRSA
jgi:DNA primase